MPERDKMEHYIENILHHEREAERKKEEERRARASDYALHHPDLSSGSETLDD